MNIVSWNWHEVFYKDGWNFEYKIWSTLKLVILYGKRHSCFKISAVFFLFFQVYESFFYRYSAKFTRQRWFSIEWLNEKIESTIPSHCPVLSLRTIWHLKKNLNKNENNCFPANISLFYFIHPKMFLIIIQVVFSE